MDLHATTGPSISGSTVVLTLANVVSDTDTNVKVRYTKPATDNNNRIEDAAGNETDSFSDQDVSIVTVPVVTIEAGTSPVTEGTAATFTVTSTSAVGKNYTVNLTVADVSGSDFVAAGNEGSKTVTINALAQTATYSVATVDDSTDETNGDVTVTVATGTDYEVGSPSAASVRVNDNDGAANSPATGAPTISGFRRWARP